MLNHLVLTSYGPFVEPFTVDIPKEGCTITGPSGSGKSSIVDAFALVHWGTMIDGSPVCQPAIRGQRASFRATSGGTTLRVAVAPGPSWRRELTPDGSDPRAVQTAERLAAELDALDPTARYGSRGETARRIMRPESWIDTYLGETGPRRFRDALVAALPPVDVTVIVAGLMEAAGHQMNAADPVELADKGPKGATVPGALTRQREANTASTSARAVADREALALRGAEATLAGLVANAPTAEQLADADTTIAAFAEWRAYDATLTTWQDGEARRLAASGRLDAYRARVAALGAEPVVDAEAAAVAATALTRAQAEQERLTAAVATLAAEVKAEEAKAEADRVAELRRVEEEQHAERQRLAAEDERVKAEERLRVALKEQEERAKVAAERAKAEAAEAQRVAVARAQEEARRPVPAPEPTPAPAPTPVAFSRQTPSGAGLFSAPAPAPKPATVCPTCGKPQ